MICRAACFLACAGVPRHAARQVTRHPAHQAIPCGSAELGGALAGQSPGVPAHPTSQTPPSQRRKKRIRDGGVWGVGWLGGGAGPASKSPEVEYRREREERKGRKEIEKEGWEREIERKKEEEEEEEEGEGEGEGEGEKEEERERRDQQIREKQTETGGTKESYRAATRVPGRDEEGGGSRLRSAG